MAVGEAVEIGMVAAMDEAVVAGKVLAVGDVVAVGEVVSISKWLLLSEFGGGGNQSGEETWVDLATCDGFVVAPWDGIKLH